MHSYLRKYVDVGPHIQALVFIGVNENSRTSLESVLLNKIFAENRTLFAKQFSRNFTLLDSDFCV
jgi:hypothetical protein